MSIEKQETAPVTERQTILFDKYAEKYDADVLLFNGIITSEYLKVLDIINRHEKRKNVLLILVTPGGDPHIAYQMARILQQSYEKFSMYITGQCKSAGSLIALGAHELVFSTIGELGPLDIQLPKKDEALSLESGLTILAALHALQEEAATYTGSLVRQILYRHSATLSTITVTEIVTRLIVGLYEPLLKQLDPMYLGEVSRALKISEEYGKRLIEVGQNLEPANLQQLTSAYPSHAFIIDNLEAKRLFKSVRPPNALEQLISLALGDLAILPMAHNPILSSDKLLYLNSENNASCIQQEIFTKKEEELYTLEQSLFD